MCLLRGLAVVSAVDLDDEPFLQAHEVDDVGSDRMLATEAETAEAADAQLPTTADNSS
jgi:hypothetical protein